MPMIRLKISGENDNKVHDILIAASRGITSARMNELQLELQELIDNLDVRLPLSGRAMGNTGDESVPFNINGTTVIRKDFDEDGYAEKLLDTLNEIANNQSRPGR